ncbi:hypothetical protein RCL_jg28765.t1 [Rhizophagus clarus]|uniref:Uncharacterized protein n=1 Tax=Rhizophagus clarus TaxID=94130 RepID=A0A8H3QX03_9GLOM|nr:hypothetical protein RCL_jg28765.t1 [Rhizophagus clarus]
MLKLRVMESVYDERVTKPIKQRTLEVGVGEPIIVSDSSPIKKNDLKLRGQGNQTMKDIIFAGNTKLFYRDLLNYTNKNPCNYPIIEVELFRKKNYYRI